MTDKICKKCGAIDRYPSTGRCRRCNSLRCAAYRSAHLESKRAGDTRYRFENPARYLLCGARYRSKLDGRRFDLTIDDIVIPEYCPIFGLKLQPGVRKLCPSSPTIDRIDPMKDYIKGNVWVISHRANRCKSDLTLEELIQLAEAVRRRLSESPTAP